MRAFYLLVIFLALSSCSSDTDSTVETSSESVDIPLIAEDSVDTEIEIVNEELSGPSEFFIEDLPAKWFMLTDSSGTGEPLIIQHYCDAETENIVFEAQKGDDWNVYMGYGQDGDVGEISDFKAVQEEMELYQVVNGSFWYQSMYNEELKEVTFMWNMDLEFAFFRGLGFSSTYFTAEETRSSYVEVDENCDDFWE